uniref:SUMO-activating enzyme subunit n=1 Tax=Meloidogyne floridensis TaxID=298350 RepID=A0A915PBS9_9BILA
MISFNDPDFEKKIAESKVFVIGAGGIGCELLKNLVMSGFKNITIDLDTIEISNLNRQFLFRKEHVGKSKAEIASSVVKQMSPDVNITFYHDSIMNEKFGVDFFRSFSLIMSALDNRAARSHVNRLCLVADVPLVESGSAGYLGQVSVILKGRTECYDCTPKPIQKTFPSCTIRNTPSELIHCIVWAKSAFNQLFGENDPDDDVSPEMDSMESLPTVSENSSTDNASTNGHHTTKENSANGSSQHIEQPKIHLNTRQLAENNGYEPKHLFDKLFHTDINYLLLMADLWKERKKPTPIKFSELVSSGLGGSNVEKVSLDPNTQWSIPRWAQVFEESTVELACKYKEIQQQSDKNTLVWDKDDDPAMRFVAACANLRAHIFHIGIDTLFNIKAMAGNIIPAIATTNACVAGMVVVEALKIICGQFDKCRAIFVTRQPNPRGKILVDEKPAPPNPNCYVCSVKGQVLIRLNLERMLLKTFLSTILLKTLNMLKPDVMDICQKHRVLISSEEGETDGIMDRTLQTLGVLNGSQLECDDYAQQLNFKIIIFHDDKLDADGFAVDSNVGNVEESVTGKIAATALDNENALDKDEELKRKRPSTAQETREVCMNEEDRMKDGSDDIEISPKRSRLE